jgi:hypothetical protein
MPEDTVRHIHENKESRPDSLEIGSASKGGVVKVYFNAYNQTEDQIKALIDMAFVARAYAASKQVTP